MEKLSARIADVENLLREIKEDVDKNADIPVVGVQFPVERIGRLSTKVLFFKGSENMKLGDKVIIYDPCPFVRRNYGDAPVGIVTMNGNYASLTAQAENFRVIDTAVLYGEDVDDIPIDTTMNSDDDDEFSVCGITNIR